MAGAEIEQAISAKRVLIFTACYNERANIGPLIEQIFAVAPDVHMLVVDDSSPDGTWDVIKDYQQKYPRLLAVKRPGKRGIGSAHKYALYYAMREGYDALLTMDADFSHDPKYIPTLLAHAAPNVFVTGSRYCRGGSSDYSGYRAFVSRLGNFAARNLLNLGLRELTTYFRVFDVTSLSRLPLRLVQSNGYSYGVQIIYYLRKAGVELRELPIHFNDRLHGVSKIPKLQIILSASDLIRMWVARMMRLGVDLRPDVHVSDACVSCGDRVLAMKFAGTTTSAFGADEAAAYSCTAVGTRSYPPVYTCLNCGLDQVPRSFVPSQLEQLYENVKDETYLKNIPVRQRTFAKSFDQMMNWLPQKTGSMLEVGAYCGLFLKEAAKRNWRCEGVEPSRWAAQYAREVSGVTVHTGFLADQKERLRHKYDVIVAWDVLEHVSDPVKFIRECDERLAEDGTLIFSTLDTSSWVPSLLKTRWPWLMDMHILYFDVKSVADVLRRAGYDLIAAEPYTHYAWVRYLLEGGTRSLPRILAGPIKLAARLIPSSWMVPVAFGDIKMYVARRARLGNSPAGHPAAAA